jgi:hypothetical protein
VPHGRLRSRMGDHEVHNGHVVALEKKIEYYYIVIYVFNTLILIRLVGWISKMSWFDSDRGGISIISSPKNSHRL